MEAAARQPDGVPEGALPVWPPPTALSPAGAGGGGFQSRSGAAVLPPPAPPPIIPPPVPGPPAVPAPEPRPGGDPVWPAEGASSQYGDWARRQRPPGTVYGGSPPAYDQPQAPAGPPGAGPPGYPPPQSAPPARSMYETSGSLAGHLLTPDRPDKPDETSASSRVVMIILIVMSILVVAGLGLGIAYLAGLFH